MGKIKVLAIQVGWTPDKEDNLRRGIALMEEGLAQYGETDLICLPEFFYECPSKKGSCQAGEPLNGTFFRTLSKYARNHQVNLITGTFLQKKEGKLYNTALAINREGQLLGEYSKIHLFDALTMRESDYLSPGNRLGVFDFDFGRVGVAVCYEVRFPEYLRTLALQQIDLLVIPAMFYRPREEQWDLLVRSAALGNLLYVVAPNQYGEHCFGRSQIVDPSGIPVSQAEDGEGVCFAVLDTEHQSQMRKELAIYENRVPEIYEVEN